MSPYPNMPLMKYALSLLFLPLGLFAQDYKWGGTEKYKNQDSLFVE